MIAADSDVSLWLSVLCSLPYTKRATGCALDTATAVGCLPDRADVLHVCVCGHGRCLIQPCLTD